MAKETVKKTTSKKTTDITNKELQDIISKQNEQLKNSVNNYKRLMILLIILVIISVISQGLYFYAHKDMYDTMSNVSSIDIIKEKEDNNNEEVEEVIDYSEYVGTYKVMGYRLNIKSFDKENINFTVASLSTNERIASISTEDDTIKNVVINGRKVEFEFTDDNFGNSGKGSLVLKDNSIVELNVNVEKMNDDAIWNITVDNIELQRED